MRPSPVPRLAASLGLALVLLGCGSSSETADPAASSPLATSAATGTPEPSLTSPNVKATRVTLTGTLADGVESGCLVFTDEDRGTTYSIASDQLAGSTLGPRVTITGTVDPEMMSFCMQGPVLLVESVTEPTD